MNMYLSSLLIETGENPDRHRPGRLWLRNLYHVHQRLCMAFPSNPRKENDPEFLAPYKSKDFPEQRDFADRKMNEVDCDTLKQVHAPRNEAAGFLFRIDPLPNGRAVIIVQSAIEPDWHYAFGLKNGLLDDRGRPFGNASHLLAALPDVKPFNPRFENGQRLRFRLVANPTKKIASAKKKEREELSPEAWLEKKGRHGKRVPVPTAQEIDDWRTKHPKEDVRNFICDKLKEWLANWLPKKDGLRIQTAGFSLDKDATIVQPGYVYFNKDGEGQGKRLRTARYDGILTVEDAERFKETLVSGIGTGKAFGFGLLSIAPADTTDLRVAV